MLGCVRVCVFWVVMIDYIRDGLIRYRGLANFEYSAWTPDDQAKKTVDRGIPWRSLLLKEGSQKCPLLCRCTANDNVISRLHLKTWW